MGKTGRSKIKVSGTESASYRLPGSFPIVTHINIIALRRIISFIDSKIGAGSFDDWRTWSHVHNDPSANTLRSEYQLDRGEPDSHPNRLANETMGPLFVEFIDEAVQTYRHSGSGNP